MSDQRPRPQYGEYAPPGWVSPVAQPDEPAAPPSPPSSAVPAAPARRPWDVGLTVALLALGLYTVVSGFVGFADAPALFRQVFTMLDIGTFSNDDAARTAGTVIVTVQTVIWLAVAALALRALRSGRLAFVWPLAGGVLANIIVGIIAAVVMAGDPAYLEYLTRSTP